MRKLIIILFFLFTLSSVFSAVGIGGSCAGGEACNASIKNACGCSLSCNDYDGTRKCIFGCGEPLNQGWNCPAPPTTPPADPDPNPNEYFIFGIETTQDNQDFKFFISGASNLEIIWGDGSTEILNGEGIQTHNYQLTGDYNIWLKGYTESIAFGPNYNLTPELLSDIYTPFSNGIDGLVNSNNMFYHTSIESFSSENFFTETSKNIDTMGNMFRDSKFNQNINDWNTSKVTNMIGVFAESNFNRDISSWNTENVENMSSMFFRSRFNQSLNDWNTSKVTKMRYMFEVTPFNQNLNNWDVSKVTSMFRMIAGSQFNGDVKDWNTISLEDMQEIFSNSSFDGNVSNWNTSKVNSMYHVFWSSDFNGDVSDWNTSNVENMERLFGNSNFNNDLSKWDTSKVTNMIGVFAESNFNQDISSWDVSKVENMKNMLDFTEFSKENYEKLLEYWKNLTLKQDVIFGVQNIEYCFGETNRQYIIDNFNWNFVGDEKLCDPLNNLKNSIENFEVIYNNNLQLTIDCIFSDTDSNVEILKGNDLIYSSIIEEITCPKDKNNFTINLTLEDDKQYNAILTINEPCDNCSEQVFFNARNNESVSIPENNLIVLILLISLIIFLIKKEK